MDQSEAECYRSDNDDDAPMSPEKQLKQEAAAAAAARAEATANQNKERQVQSRPIAKPKSIIATLKSLWNDLKSTVLSSQEERQMCDTLFEVRQEVHEAAKRGRVQGSGL